MTRDWRSVRTDWRRPYGHAMRQVCSRKKPKSKRMAAAVPRTIRKEGVAEEGEVPGGDVEEDGRFRVDAEVGERGEERDQPVPDDAAARPEAARRKAGVEPAAGAVLLHRGEDAVLGLEEGLFVVG